MNNNALSAIIDRLILHLKLENYKGYDPYDALNSYVPYRLLGHKIQVLAIQIQLRNPINLRPILGIKKDYSVKSLGLILQALSQYYQINRREDVLTEMNKLFDLLLEKRIKNQSFSGSYWAVHYPIAWKTWERPKFDPSAVLACVVFEGVFEYYKATNSSKAKDLLIDIGVFLLNNIPITENEFGKCYSYTARKKEIVYNANMYVAESLSKLFYLTKEERYKNEALKCIDFDIHYQRHNGCWGYRLYPETGKEREQIDFHQGFIINSLGESLKYLGIKDKYYESALKKAFNFYLHEQFTDDGRGYWRLPSLYPIDIHNQAVGIWIGSKYNYLSDDTIKHKVEAIVEWTLKHMYNKKKGYFYYQKRRLFINKIDYIRWNQAWMLLGLVNNYVMHYDR